MRIVPHGLTVDEKALTKPIGDEKSAIIVLNAMLLDPIAPVSPRRVQRLGKPINGPSPFLERILRASMIASFIPAQGRFFELGCAQIAT